MNRWLKIPLWFSALAIMTTHLSAAPNVPSAKEINAQQEKKYAAELLTINKKNPANDAAAAKRLGFPYLLAYNAGRSVTLIIPGVEQKNYNFAKARCPILIMDGLGDTVHGSNHMAYRKAMTNYAAQFNRITYKACITR